MNVWGLWIRWFCMNILRNFNWRSTILKMSPNLVGREKSCWGGCHANCAGNSIRGRIRIKKRVEHNPARHLQFVEIDCHPELNPKTGIAARDKNALLCVFAKIRNINKNIFILIEKKPSEWIHQALRIRTLEYKSWWQWKKNTANFRASVRINSIISSNGVGQKSRSYPPDSRGPLRAELTSIYWNWRHSRCELDCSQ